MSPALLGAGTLVDGCDKDINTAHLKFIRTGIFRDEARNCNDLQQ
jgi:hypothetical protein